MSTLHTVRRLSQVDAPLLESFLLPYAESSMFLRGNMHRAGLDYHGRALEGEYYGAFTGGAMTGVLAHYWNGNVIVQAPDPSALRALCAQLRVSATRVCAGVLGPVPQADAVIDELSLPRDGFALLSDERLYALELAALRAPHAPAMAARVPVPADAALLHDWLRSYEIEANCAELDPELDALVAARVLRMIGGGDCWLLEDRGVPVSLSGFNARLPDLVQIGPVWTPPEQRSRGYARALVAASLVAARTEGVAKAILFSANPAAIRAYEAIGFQRCGGYRLAILKQPVPLQPGSSAG